MYDILIISDDVVGEKMAGPGIRAWELSKCLSKHFRVGLAIPDYSYKSEDSQFFQDIPFKVFSYSVQNPKSLREAATDSKIILTQGFILSKFPFIKKLPAHLVVDVYVPFILENLFVHKWKVTNLKDRENIHLHDLRVANDQLIHGDHFLCANTRQRDLFIGALMSMNRINPEMLDSSPDVEELISVVPFGISKGSDQPAGSTIRNTIFPIQDDDILLLWGGVISNWFDPLTLIKALHQAIKENPRIKLLFLSTKHPNPLTPEFDMAKEAVKLCSDLNLTNNHVFFNEEWIDYQKRSVYFQDADIGISTHTTHFETRYSFRTRILDYFKHHLPIICTQGDHFAEIIQRENLGITVASGDQDELRKVILHLAEKPELRAEIAGRIEKVKQQYYWDKVVEPLIKYCQDVLSGKIPKKQKPRKREIDYIFRPKTDSFLKKAGKRIFWNIFQKIPFKFAAKIKRLLRSLD